MGFLLSCLYIFFELSPYSFPLRLHICCLSIFTLIFILLAVMTVHLPPDQIYYWSLCISSTVPSPRKYVTFPRKDNKQCIPFHTPLTLFPLGTCCEAGCWVDSSGPEVVPEGLLMGCKCFVQPCHLCRAGARDSNVKNIWWGLWESLRTVCFHALGSLACYWGQARNSVFTCLASLPSRRLFSYQSIRISH